jgi:hypothetical protein
MEHTADVRQAVSRDRSTAELVKQLSEQVSVPVRDELKLGAALLAVAAVAALLGKGRLQGAAPPLPEDAAASIKTDVEEIKERARR